MSLPAITRTHVAPAHAWAFPFVLRWHADAVIAAAALRLVRPCPWQADTGSAANAAAAPMRAPARLHSYLPAPTGGMFRIR